MHNRRLIRSRVEEQSQAGAGWLDLKPLEWALCAIVLGLCVALHFPRVYNSFGFQIEAALSLVSFATPISGMLYLSASQVIPEPPIGPLTCSQMALVGFLVWQLVRWGGALANGSLPLLKAVAPFFLWSSLMYLMHGKGFKPVLLLIFAVLTGCAAGVLAWQSRKRFLTCLLAFLLGQTAAATVFWMLKLGLGEPVQAFDTEIYGDSTAEDSLRIGTGRGNANMLGLPMAMALVGVVGLWIARPSGRGTKSGLASAIAVVWFVVAASALVGAGSRGAIVACASGAVFFVVAGLATRQFRVESMLAIVVAVVLFSQGWEKLSLGSHWGDMHERQAQQMREEGTLIAGRHAEWETAIKAILDSPLLGGGRAELLSYQGMEQYWAAHSTYLDVALAAGLPAMMLFIWFTLRPLVLLWGRRHEFAVGSVLAVYFAVIIGNAYGSALQLKSFWILWALAVAQCVLVRPADNATTPPAAGKRARMRPALDAESHVAPAPSTGAPTLVS